jgi:acyl-CoA synthetase (AMP-forming)/AMP-acid ligase II
VKSKNRLFWAFLIGALLVAVPVLMIHLDASNEQFVERTQTAATQATITSTDIGNHDAAYWQFVINGKAYTGGYPMADSVKPGDVVNVRYNPLAPSENSLGDHKPMTLFGYVLGWSITDIFILWTFFVIYSSLRRRGLAKKSSNSN